MKPVFRTSSRSLTPLYCLHQGAVSFAYAGIASFAVAYLMSKGFDTALIGMMLALTSTLSCFLQPLIGSYVDRRSMTLLPKMILGFQAVVFVALGSIELFALPLPLIGLLFTVGYLAYLMALSLNNSLCAHYSQNGYRINYGMGAGVGAFAFSLGSLAVGLVVARLGASWAIFCALALTLLDMALILCYPRLRPEDDAVTRLKKDHAVQSLSIPAFARQYRLYMVTIAGAMCLAACHSMMENFLIQIFGRVGGGSQEVGIALFLAGISSAPFLLCFERVQRRVSVEVLVRLSGLFFILKAVLLICASSVSSIYLISLLQAVTYGFVSPSLYYLTLRRVDAVDMAKGQLLSSALYTLGGGMGNSVGGAAIEYMGVNAMLLVVIGFAAAGTLLINLTLRRAKA